MNIFIRELRANSRSLIIWAVIVGLFMSIGFSKYSAYEGNPEIIEVLNGMPPAVLAAFNMNAFNLTTLTGFYGVMFTYFALLLSIAAVMWGSDIITKEERDKTVEFSLTLPIPRSRLVTAKTLAALVNCLALLAITYVATLLSARSYQPDKQFYDLVNLSVPALIVIQLIFLAVGIFLGCAMKQHKRASSAAVSLLLGTFILSVFSGLHKDLEFLKYFTPFKYFDPAMMLRESRIDIAFVWLSLAIVAICLTGAYVTYSKRDLYI